MNGSFQKVRLSKVARKRHDVASTAEADIAEFKEHVWFVPRADIGRQSLSFGKVTKADIDAAFG
jgi:hypothetical protein